MRRGLGEEIKFTRGAQNRQIGQDGLDPPRGVAQLGLRAGVTAALAR